MPGNWRVIYSFLNWTYPEHPSEKTKQAKKEMLIQIRKSNMKLNKVKRNTEPEGQIKPVKVKLIKRKKKKRKKKKN